MLARTRSFPASCQTWRRRSPKLIRRVACLFAAARRWFEQNHKPQVQPGPTAGDPPYLQSEGPRDCVLVLDRSGSMATDDWKPSRLDGAKAAAQAFAGKLAQEEPLAQVAILSYGSQATSHCLLTSVLIWQRYFRIEPLPRFRRLR